MFARDGCRGSAIRQDGCLMLRRIFSCWRLVAGARLGRRCLPGRQRPSRSGAIPSRHRCLKHQPHGEPGRRRCSARLRPFAPVCATHRHLGLHGLLKLKWCEWCGMVPVHGAASTPINVHFSSRCWNAAGCGPTMRSILPANAPAPNRTMFLGLCMNQHKPLDYTTHPTSLPVFWVFACTNASHSAAAPFPVLCLVFLAGSAAHVRGPASTFGGQSNAPVWRPGDDDAPAVGRRSGGAGCRLRRGAPRSGHIPSIRHPFRPAPDPRRGGAAAAVPDGDPGGALRSVPRGLPRRPSHQPLQPHPIPLPIRRALHGGHGPIGRIHIDEQADVNDTMVGEKLAHGTTFRRAQEEGLLDPLRVAQIGLRGTGYTAPDFDWCRDQGFRVVQVEECWGRSLVPLMQELRARVGGGPVYFTLDIDGIDPAYAPGTGTPEIAGLTVPQTLELIRGAWGLNLVGADVVEVSPPYDPLGNTALLAANLAFELLCVMPGVPRRTCA